MRNAACGPLFLFAIIFILLWIEFSNQKIIFIQGGGEAKYFDIASLLLVAATLVVTSVGVVLAVLAFVGYNDIKRLAIEAAKEDARNEAKQVAANESKRVATDVAKRVAAFVADREVKKIYKDREAMSVSTSDTIPIVPIEQIIDVGNPTEAPNDE